MAAPRFSGHRTASDEELWEASWTRGEGGLDEGRGRVGAGTAGTGIGAVEGVGTCCIAGSWTGFWKHPCVPKSGVPSLTLFSLDGGEVGNDMAALR